MRKLVDTFKQTADTIAFLDRGSGVNAPDVQSAIERLAQRINQYGLNVRDFGAKGDGVTDDTQAFEDAISALRESGGGSLFIPKGVYLIHKILIDFSNVRIFGEGDSTILKQKPFDFVWVFPEPDRIVNQHAVIQIWGDIDNREITVENIHISHLVVDADYENITMPPERPYHGDIEGIDIDYARNVTIENVKVFRAHADGIDTDSVENVSIVNCYAEDCGKAGIIFSRGTHYSRIVNSYVKNCVHRFKAAFDEGLTTQYRGAIATNPTVGGNWYQTVDSNAIIGCVAENNYRNFSLLGDNTVSVGNIEIGGDEESDFSGVV